MERENTNSFEDKKPIIEEEKKVCNPNSSEINNIKPKSYTLFILGSTGTGKSTLVNVFDGSAKKEKSTTYNQDFEFVISENENSNNSKSVTKKVTLYSFENIDENEIFNVYDTPGLDDTEGFDQDDINFDNILETLSTIDMLNCIILVVKATDTRLTKGLDSAIKKLIAIVPKKYYKNIIIAATFCHRKAENIMAYNLVKDCIKDDSIFNEFKTIWFNNDYFSLKRNGQEKEKYLKKSYKKSIKQVTVLKQMIKNLEPFNSCSEYKNLKENNNKATTKIYELRNYIINLIEKKEQILKIKDDIENAKNDIELYKNFKETLYTYNWEEVDCDYHNTICAECFLRRINSVCHDHCGLEFCNSQNKGLFQKCACICKGFCTICKCGPETHFHKKKMPMHVKKSYISINEFKKSKFSNASDVSSVKKSLQDKINNDISELDNKIKDAPREIHEYIEAMKVDFPLYNYQVNLDSAVNSMKKDLEVETDPHKRQNLSDSIHLIGQVIFKLFGS